MTLQDLGNLGEFIGSIAVVITLIYLARQIRQGRAWWDKTEFIMPVGLRDTINVALANPDIKRKSITEEHPWLFE